MMYTGAMEKGQMHGKGTLVYPNNERYEGDFRHGKRHGYLHRTETKPLLNWA